MPHEFVRPFHFWCQKVLPLVFDDSLSYYEVLAKMRDYLNSAIEEINAIGGEFEGVKNQLTQLQTYVDEYFAKLDVNQAISDKLDDMVESGEMDAVITPIFAAYANPLFAASVADMIATNFAYANYENNKIYTFNQSTGLYQTTGKEFGGVVSSVDEMEDNDKYYALDSDGMLYSYDYPQSVFVATGLTYGGYRYGVNAMRPIANTYVLTTDSHVYMWNGNEYVDTGVVYGLSNTAFIWRRKLTSADNVTTLIVDGWYSFNENDLPTGLPVNMSVSDGFVIVCSLPNDVDDSDNVTTSSDNRVDTQRSEGIRADSRNKRIVLKTCNGGSWFWNGENWLSENEIGFPVCQNCNHITWNSVTICNESTVNSPVHETAILKTMSNGENTSQIIFTENTLWFRYDNGNWIEIANESDVVLAKTQISALWDITTVLNSSISQIENETNRKIENFESKVSNELRLFTTLRPKSITTENELIISNENNEEIIGEVTVIKTDTTLTKDDTPAEANAVGTKISELTTDINGMYFNLNATIMNVQQAIQAMSDLVDNSISTISEKIGVPLLTENTLTITNEYGDLICAIKTVALTDASLSLEHVPADAKATGVAIQVLNSQIIETNENVTNNAIEISTIKTLTESVGVQIVTQSNDTVVCENNYNLYSNTVGLKTDLSLTERNVAADAYATGKRLSNIENLIDPYRLVQIEGTAITNKLTMVELFGTFPNNKTYVNMRCKITTKNTTFTGNCQLKVQGSSSVGNPEKNYTLKLPEPVQIAGYTTDTWNLKCNYIDPAQIRNILSAKLWAMCLKKLLPDTIGMVSTQNGDIILNENGDNLLLEQWNENYVMISPHCGCTDGELCCVTHDNEFHGLYTIGIPKSGYMMGMDLVNNQWLISTDNGSYFIPVDTEEEFYNHYKLEEKSANTNKTRVYNQINNFFIDIANANADNLEAVISSKCDINILLAYLCFIIYTNHIDGIGKNTLIYSYDNGKHFNFGAWDMDCTFGNNWRPDLLVTSPISVWLIKSNALYRKLIDLKAELVKNMWANLREDVLTRENVFSLISELTTIVNSALYTIDAMKWPKGKTVSRDVNSIMTWISLFENHYDEMVERM